MQAQLEEQDKLYTFKEAMAYLRTSRSTIYRLLWSGQLPGYKVGYTWRFRHDHLKRVLRPSTTRS